MSLVGTFLLKFVHLISCTKKLETQFNTKSILRPVVFTETIRHRKMISKKLSFLILIFTLNSSDHLNAVGAIKISDGSLQDFHKALDHVLNLLKDQLTTPGKLNETEFVRLWFNLHSYFNNFDTSE